jgi:two-component system sensor histidine kinase/response regulator
LRGLSKFNVLMSKTGKQAITSLLDKLIGSESEYSLENRFFNSICILLFIMIIIFIPVDFVLGINTMAWIFLAHFPLLCVVYYFSLFKKKYQLSVLIVGVLMQGVLILNFFYNDGIDGPTIIYFFLVASLTTTISNDRLKFIWLIVNLITGLSLIFIQYLIPETIKYSYELRQYRILDIAVSFIICTVLIYWNTKFILVNYTLQKNRAEAQTKQLTDQAEKLTQLHAEKDRLFSIVSHDFRSPLASIENGLELIQSVQLTEDERKTITGQLVAQVKNTAEMLDNILHWSRNQIQSTVPVFQLLNIHEAIQQSTESLLLLSNQKGISIHNEVDPTLTVHIDAEILQVVLRNLISNAVKFSPAGSEVRIKGVHKKDFVELEIIDQGIGISEEQMETIFSFKAKSTFGTSNEKGMGLGLFLTNELIQKIGGYIQVSSSLNQGTIFKVIFPVS